MQKLLKSWWNKFTFYVDLSISILIISPEKYMCEYVAPCEMTHILPVFLILQDSMVKKAKVSMAMTLKSVKYELLRNIHLSFKMMLGFCFWYQENKNWIDEICYNFVLFWAIVVRSLILPTFILTVCQFGLLGPVLFCLFLLTFLLRTRFFSFLPLNLIEKEMMLTTIYRTDFFYSSSEVITSTQTLVLRSLHSDIEAVLYLKGVSQRLS